MGMADTRIDETSLRPTKKPTAG